MLFDGLSEEMKSHPLYYSVSEYAFQYCKFNGISSPEIIESHYLEFISAFNKDCKRFNKTGEYPFESDRPIYGPSRTTYDLALILSVLFTNHRFEMMLLIHSMELNGNALFVGVGPGIEMDITQQFFHSSQGYDLQLNPFVREYFNNVTLHEEAYTGQDSGKFDCIFLIEILEHVENPRELLTNTIQGLRPGGRIIFTTATNIPQFDHLYKFPTQPLPLIEGWLKEKQMELVSHFKINHHYMRMNVEASNDIFVYQKDLKNEQ